jgi:hypothetical protein
MRTRLYPDASPWAMVGPVFKIIFVTATASILPSMCPWCNVCGVGIAWPVGQLSGLGALAHHRGKKGLLVAAGNHHSGTGFLPQEQYLGTSWRYVLSK